MVADPYEGLGDPAWAQLFGGVSTIDQALAADTSTPATAQPHPTPQQLLTQIPIWVWVALGGSLLIIFSASKR